MSRRGEFTPLFEIFFEVSKVGCIMCHDVKHDVIIFQFRDSQFVFDCCVPQISDHTSPTIVLRSASQCLSEVPNRLFTTYSSDDFEILADFVGMGKFSKVIHRSLYPKNNLIVKRFRLKIRFLKYIGLRSLRTLSIELPACGPTSIVRDARIKYLWCTLPQIAYSTSKFYERCCYLYEADIESSEYLCSLPLQP